MTTLKAEIIGDKEMEKKKTKLTGSEKLNLVVEAGISAIPYVGGAIQTIYFGAQNEKRFKRIELFYEKLQDAVNKLAGQVATNDDILTHQSQISDFIEQVNEVIERTDSLAKLSMLHNAFLRIITNPSSISWEEEPFFMSTIPQLDMPDILLLSLLQPIPEGKWATRGEIISKFSSFDKFFLEGLIGRLVGFGYLEERLGSINMTDNGTFIDHYYRITGLGSRFLAFTMQPPVKNDTGQNQ